MPAWVCGFPQYRPGLLSQKRARFEGVTTRLDTWPGHRGDMLQRRWFATPSPSAIKRLMPPELAWLPIPTPLDPAEDPPGSVDPLGTLADAERLAELLLPGFTV